jgi:signal transduction histidine kinase
MHKRFFIILLFYFVGNVFSQNLLPPFRFEPVDTIPNYFAGKGNFFSLDSTEYVVFTPAENLKYKRSLEIISRKSKKLQFTFTMENFKMLPDIFIGDIDGDSLSEMVFAATGNQKLKFFYYNSGEIAELLNIDLGRPAFNGGYFIIPSQVTGDERKEIVIVIGSIMPMPGSIRGIFAVDPVNHKVIWKKYFADFISTYIPFNKKGEDYLALFSFSRNEGFYYANGKFYVDRVGVSQAKNIDTDAPDYSCDSISVMKIFKMKNGEMVFQKRLAGSGILIDKMKGNLNEYDGILIRKQISIIKGQRYDVLYGFNKRDFSLKPIIKFPHYITSTKTVYFGSKTIVQVSDSTAMVIKNGRLREIKLNFPPYTKIYNFLKTGLGYLFIAANAVENLVYDENQNLLATSEGRLRIKYMKGTGNIFFRKYVVNRKPVTVFLKMEETPIFDRIPTKTYLYLTTALFALFLFITLLWASTMFYSQKKIKRQSKELEITTSKLLQAEKLSALGTIAGSIAHQINSPLGAILNAATRLKRKGIDDANVNLIKEAGERIKTIVNKFLVTTHTSEEEQRGVTFDEVFEAWYELFTHDFANQGIRIIADIKNADVIIPLTRSEVNEIINNLMFNARDAVIAANEAGKREIKISTVKKGEKFLIEIADNGTGFNEDILKKGIRIFATTKERGKGTGLGLWILTIILRNVHGKIKLANGEKGAIVTVEIPLNNPKKKT